MFSFLTIAAAIVVLVFVLDQLYQRFSHKWTNEPPLLPYRIPFFGHSFQYSSDRDGLYRRAHAYFPDGQPYCLMFLGRKLYVFTQPKDVTTIFRKAKELPFLPLVEEYGGLAWGVSPNGVKKMAKVDEEGDSLFRNAHDFYREALKPGPALDELTLGFLRHAQEKFDEVEAVGPYQDFASFWQWSRTMIGATSGCAMMGPALFKKHPGFLKAAFDVDQGFFAFVNSLPRFFARAAFDARDHVLDCLSEYVEDPKMLAESAPMIRARIDQLRGKGMSVRDIAAGTFASYIPLVANATEINYQIIRHLYGRQADLAAIRAEIAPAFKDGRSITTLEQTHYLTTNCPLLRAFFDEALRMYGTVPSNRRVTEDTLVNGYTMKRGLNILMPSYIQHQTESYFGANPAVFNPYRFLDSTGKPANPSMIRAFGGGVSLCPGRHFAGNEVLSFVASLAWRFDIEFKGKGAFTIKSRK